jgi:tRNA G18 (ribose-2'-O)-methylase SpoU
MHNIIPIHDRDDPRLYGYRDIKERDLRGRDGLFVAEGKVVIERLLVSNLYDALSILTTNSRLEALRSSLPRTSIPIYLVCQDIMDEVAGFAIHRGYLALGRKKTPNDWDGLWDLLKQREKLRFLILSAIANTDNMGGVFRNAAAFGVDAVLLDETCCDPLYRKAIRVSVGGVFHVPHLRLADWYSKLLAHDVIPLALSPFGSIAIEDLVPPDRYGLVIGAEGPGLSDSILASMETVRIDMAGGFDSLNLATTSGIALYALS